MAGARGGRRRKRGGGDEHGPDERWLVSYADMITLLMCLFMVLFSISSVNTSKFDSLQKSLDSAFSGAVLPGGKAVLKTGNDESPNTRPAAQAPIEALRMITPAGADESQDEKALRKEDEDFKRLKAKLDAYAKRRGLEGKINTEISRRGLVITVLTDKLLFDSGEADVSAAADDLIGELTSLISRDEHQIAVEGHTDSEPISGGQYPSNWELSTARASAILRSLTGRGVNERRFEAAGFASLYPVADNSSADGRSRNRRVEIVLLRKSLERHGRPFNP